MVDKVDKYKQKLAFLSEYMKEWIDKWPDNKSMGTFEEWNKANIIKKNKLGDPYNQEHCWYCSKEFNETTIKKSRDHVVPRSKGGGKKGKQNIRYACQKCNSWKSSLPLTEWRDKIKKIEKQINDMPENPKQQYKNAIRILKYYTKEELGSIVGVLTKMINENKKRAEKEK